MMSDIISVVINQSDEKSDTPNESLKKEIMINYVSDNYYS